MLDCWTVGRNSPGDLPSKLDDPQEQILNPGWELYLYWSWGMVAGLVGVAYGWGSLWLVEWGGVGGVLPWEVPRMAGIAHIGCCAGCIQWERWLDQAGRMIGWFLFRQGAFVPWNWEWSMASIIQSGWFDVLINGLVSSGVIFLVVYI